MASKSASRRRTTRYDTGQPSMAALRSTVDRGRAPFTTAPPRRRLRFLLVLLIINTIILILIRVGRAFYGTEYTRYIRPKEYVKSGFWYKQNGHEPGREVAESVNEYVRSIGRLFGNEFREAHQAQDTENAGPDAHVVENNLLAQPVMGEHPDHPHEPASVSGKSKEQAEEDRRIVLEDLDQETLKAMFDALYGGREAQ